MMDILVRVATDYGRTDIRIQSVNDSDD